MDRRDFLANAGAWLIGLALAGESFADERRMPKIYLTIDDGPREYMNDILKTLGKKNKATFFMVGKEMKDASGFYAACQALEAGHEIGNHSFSHPEFSKITFEEARAEIEKTDELICRAYGEAGREIKRLFRFPYGDVGYLKRKTGGCVEHGSRDKKDEIAAFLKTMKYKTVFWDVDSQDWLYYSKNRTKELPEILVNISSARSGDIVLMHEIPVTAEHLIPYIVSSGRYLSVSI